MLGLVSEGVEIDGGHGLSRGEVILKGALAAGALYGLSAMGPYISRALAVTESDLETLNFLLPCEYVQIDLYERGLTKIGDKGEKIAISAEEIALIERLLDEERQHLATLTAEIRKLGGKPDKKGHYSFAYRSAEVFLQLAVQAEQAAIDYYNSSLPLFESTRLKELAGSIVQVEGRQAAEILIQLGEPPSPDAVDTPTSQLEAIGSLIKFGGP